MKLIKIKMLKTRRGQHDRYNFFKYEEGQVYNVPYSLAQQYILYGIGKEVVEHPVTKKRKGKVL